jgi:spermidine/putrescine-binding protein
MSLLAASILFSSCSKSETVSNKSAGELNLFIWTEYIPESVIKAFENETGVRVNMATYSSNEDMLSKVKSSAAGTYDIVVPSDYMIKMMISENLLSEINKSEIDNIKNIELSYLNRDFDPENKFSIPYMAGVMGLVINKTKVSEDITSISDIFNPLYKKSLVVLDDYRAVIGAVAKSMGYSLNVIDKEALEKIDKRIQELKPNVKLRDSDSPKTAMLNGETSIGLMWNAEIAICMQESDNFKVVFPKEGCYLFLDNLAILKNAKNAENAKKFINFILRADISKMISEEYPYTTPNKAALDLLSDSYKNNIASNVPPEVFRDGEFIQDIGSKVEEYDKIWTKFTK